VKYTLSFSMEKKGERGNSLPFFGGKEEKKRKIIKKRGGCAPQTVEKGGGGKEAISKRSRTKRGERRLSTKSVQISVMES